MRRYLPPSTALLFCFIVQLFLLERSGLTGRGAGRGGVFIAGSPQAAIEAAKGSGGRGFSAICLSLRSRSTAIDDGKLIPYRPFPVKPVDVIPLFEKETADENILWALMQTGTVRGVYYALPGSAWDGISEKITGVRGVSPPLDINYRGSPIVLSDMDGFEPPEGPTLLFVDGTLLASIGPEGVIEFMDRKGIAPDLSIVYMGKEAEEGMSARVHYLKQLLDERMAGGRD